MKTRDIIAYMNACEKIKEAVVAKTYSDTPHSVRIFDIPFDKDSKSYVLGLGQRRMFKIAVKNLWDYCVTTKVLDKKEKNLLETLIKEMGPLSDIC